MFEQLSDALTRENLLRHRFRIEIAAAIIYVLIAIGEQTARAGIIGILTVLAMASAIVLHRIHPAAALLIVGTVPLVLLVTGFSGSSPTTTLWIPVLLVLFGAAAYGHPATRWAALVAAVLGGLLVSAATYATYALPSFGSLLLIPATLGLFLVPWIGGTLVRVNRQRQAAQDSATVATAERNELEESVTVEQERNRVARDVHDIVAHSLAVVVAQADGARYAVAKNPDAVDDALDAIATTARAALDEVRVLLAGLRHSQTAGPQPGMDDLDALVRGFRESGLAIEWSAYGRAQSVSETTGLAVYRIVQESLTNALRHGSRVSPVDLEFDWGDTALTLTVTNDLADGEPTHNPSGHGIPGMRERASLVGGAVSTGTGNNGRFRVRAVLPIDRGTARTQPMARVAAE